MENIDFESQRELMVTRHLAGRDITDPAVLDAFRAIPRERFMDPGYRDEAYADHPVRINCGQTISQPYIVAYMTQLLCVKPGMKVMEIGTGSGYQTAILAHMGAEIHTVERHEELTDRAAPILEELGLDKNIHFHIGDGTQGLADEAPFGRIIVTAAPPQIPEPLKEQLTPDGGRMVIPAGDKADGQKLYVVTSHEGKIQLQADLPVIFVPLVSDEG